MKKVFIIVGSVIVALIMIALAIIFFFWYAFGGSAYFTRIPKPGITYGEFPISITYELNGEKKILSDTIICEFDGYEVLGEAGKYRKWKSHLKSGNEHLVLLKGYDNNAFEIRKFYGTADYYMGDLRHESQKSYEKTRDSQKGVDYITWQNGVQTGTMMTVDEVYKKYGLKIIEVKYSKPIQNNFK